MGSNEDIRSQSFNFSSSLCLTSLRPDVLRFLRCVERILSIVIIEESFGLVLWKKVVQVLHCKSEGQDDIQMDRAKPRSGLAHGLGQPLLSI